MTRKSLSPVPPWTRAAASSSSHLANFSVRIAWPADGETLFLGNDGQLSLSLLGSVQGCSQCTGTIKAFWQLDGNDDGAEAHPLTLDEAGTFRENITFSHADNLTISVRAEQAISDTELDGEASEPSPAFQSEAAVSFTVRDSSEKPPETITILSPADNSVLSWRDDADLSSDSLEISVTAALEGFQLDDAVFDVFVDSQLAASTSDRTCSLTTSGTVVTGLSCPLAIQG